MSVDGRWIHINCQRALYVDRGRETILCDRDIPSELLILVSPEAIELLKRDLAQNSNDEAAA